MIITLVVAPIVGIYHIAHHPELFAQSIPEALTKAGPDYHSLTKAVSGFSIGVVIDGGLSWFFGYLGGQPQLSMRFMSIKNAQQARIGRNVGITWTILAYIGSLCIGWIGVGYVWAGIGSTFSVVILLSLFWKRYHGKAALITIITGIVFTIVWISSGLDEKVITARVMTFFVAGLAAIISTLAIPRRTEKSL